jgi:hypothetical protein
VAKREYYAQLWGYVYVCVCACVCVTRFEIVRDDFSGIFFIRPAIALKYKLFGFRPTRLSENYETKLYEKQKEKEKKREKTIRSCS